MAANKMMIVESPSKAKTIGGYLGKDFIVMASYGHIRNIPARSTAVEPENDFFIHYEVPEKSKKPLMAIARAIKSHKCDQLYIATDLDREGEAMGWHIVAELMSLHAINRDTEVKRVTFNEITKSAIQKAVEHPRAIDEDLVNAQQARCSLDYLIGFNISPILWRKLPGSRSAGRVQSVALRMICDREHDIDKFVPQEYRTVECLFSTSRNTELTAHLYAIDGTKLEKFDINNEEKSSAILVELKKREFKIVEVKKQVANRNPYPPFITSTLQQEASRRLGFSPSRTMRAAQKLYEGVNIGGKGSVGLITYMRTDGLYVSDDAIAAVRKLIGESWGSDYLPSAKREYKKKIKNAQEAHEAIRPTDPSRLPKALSDILGNDEHKLYELIWNRMVASQMASAKYERLTVTIDSTDSKYTLRASGSKLIFDGFLKLTRGDDDGSATIDVEDGDALSAKQFVDQQHFTEPPPRFSEASLIANLEELGIGRPSTYASIINVLQDRMYVENRNRVFFPTTRGRMVAVFLKNFFAKYVEYDYTATLEEELDEISNGAVHWKKFLQSFWVDFAKNVGDVGATKPDDIMGKLSAQADYLVPGVNIDQSCPQCGNGKLRLRMSKHGPFLCCSCYPECNHSQAISGQGGSSVEEQASRYPKLLGVDPESGKEISVRSGPYGFYIQLGEADVAAAGAQDAAPKQKKPARGKAAAAVKPKRISIPKSIPVDSVDLDSALNLLSLPKLLGSHPETGLEIKVGVGMFGPYISYSGKFISIASKYNFLTLTMEEALEIMGKSRKLQQPDNSNSSQVKRKSLNKASTAAAKRSVTGKKRAVTRKKPNT